MNITSVSSARCFDCRRSTTKRTFDQRYIGPTVQRVQVCVDQRDCAKAMLEDTYMADAR